MQYYTHSCAIWLYTSTATCVGIICDFLEMVSQVMLLRVSKRIADSTHAHLCTLMLNHSLTQCGGSAGVLCELLQKATHLGKISYYGFVHTALKTGLFLKFNLLD